MSCEELQTRLAEAEAEITRLRAEIQVKDERIAELETVYKAKVAHTRRQEETLISLEKESIVTFDAVSEALEVVIPGRESKKFIAEANKAIKETTDEDRPFITNIRTRAAAMMIKEATPPAFRASEDEDERFEYSTKTRTENRAEAIIAHMKETGKATIKSTEARAVLETHEGHGLDRKIVHRALSLAQTLMKASKDRIGGVTRLMIPSLAKETGHSEHQNHQVFSIGGDGGTLPRSRKWGVPWDG